MSENATNALQVFSNDHFKVRVIYLNNEPWFVAKDVCKILGYANARDALNMHLDEDEKHTVTIRYGNRGTPDVNIINERGLYCLILRSKKRKAVAFRLWVSGEVLPAIRKQAFYVSNPKQVEIDGLMRNCRRLMDENIKLRAELESTRSFCILGEAIAVMPSAMTIGEAAKVLAHHGLNKGLQWLSDEVSSEQFPLLALIKEADNDKLVWE